MSGAGLLAVGLDAAEWRLVRRLVDAGRLPVLAELLRNGHSGELQSVAAEYAGGVWPTFYTGKPVPWHGIYHSKLWRSERMRCEVAHGDWLAERPFWEHPSFRRIRACVIDVPMTVAAPRPINGLQIAGWGTHDLIVSGATPPGLWRNLRRRHGPPAMRPERFGPQSERSLCRLRDELLRSVSQMAGLGEDLLRRDSWDLFLTVFGAPHRAGHYLLERSLPDTTLEADRRGGALETIYEACDEALGRLIAAAGTRARVLVFAVHGMERNAGWGDHASALLERMRNPTAAPPKRGVLYTAKRCLPTRWSESVVSLLPRAARHRLVELWSARMYDWRTTRYFAVPNDQAAYVRVNLKGREAGGIVEPGRDYQALCHELAAGFRSWRGLSTGKAVVGAVAMPYADAPVEAPCRSLLPDLIITWSPSASTETVGLASSLFGEFRPGPSNRLPSGRSGNHSPRGWFVATGPGVIQGEVTQRHIMDLAPTICAALGMEGLPGFQGRPVLPVS